MVNELYREESKQLRREEEKSMNVKLPGETQQDLLNQEVSEDPVIRYLDRTSRVSGPEDLQPKGLLALNPPPKDGRCDCCGKPLAELRPYGGPGDPLVGDFEGVLLLKNYRPMGPYDEEADEAVLEAYGNCTSKDFDDVLNWLVEKYGKEKGEEYMFCDAAHDQIGSSWECRDCKILDQDEYFAKLKERYATEKKQFPKPPLEEDEG